MNQGHRLFVFGLGFSGLALAEALHAEGWRVAGTCRSPQTVAALAGRGIEAWAFERGRPLPPGALAGTSHLLSSVPPDAQGDPVLDEHGADILALRPALAWAGYLSTTGVYGDRDGGWVDEDSELRPTGPRQRQRVAAESRWLALWPGHGLPVHGFRLAGIYGPGRSALDSVRAGTARRIDKPGHLFSRIHVADIVGVLRASMARPRPGVVYNVCDDHPAPGHEVVAHACALLGVVPPPLVPFDQAALSPMAASFYADNKRVRNERIKSELGIRLRYPDYRSGLDAQLAAERGIASREKTSMHQPTVAPYGTWASPISADLIVGGTIKLGHVAVDGGDTWWAEQRPAEGGRSVVLRLGADGEPREMTPPGWGVRSRIHEYGGGDFVARDGVVWFANAADQRVWRADGAGDPVPVTPEGPWRYADFVLDAARNRLICVREDHGGAGPEPVNTIVALALDGVPHPGSVLASGADFYAAPRLNPDGSRLAWIEWRHPHMPWDETELKLAAVAADGTLDEAIRVAGGPRISVMQPNWSPQGELFFVDDRAEWWNLRRWHGARSVPVLKIQAEFARPLWQLGQSTYDFTADGRVVAAYIMDGVWSLTEIDPVEETMTPIELPYTDIATVVVAGSRVVLTAGSPTEAAALVELDLRSRVSRVLRRTAAPALGHDCISAAQPIEFVGFEGRTAHGYYYPPLNRGFAGPAGERPPLLVKVHGGPTGATSSTLNLGIQFWTSRGFAVLDVNYTGSTGYGTAYRRRLYGRWGVADVADVVAGTRYLVDAGLVDGDRLAISGSSAGGFTVLCALAFHDLFKAGASYYGVSDLEALVVDSHKFEIHYTESLVGPWPDARDVYRARSPVHHAGRIACPMIFFQGLEDKVVPPSQTERMVAALQARGVPVDYVGFPGEMHGLRVGANIRRALEAELDFYRRVFRIG